MELVELYHKIYTKKVLAEDYVQWAKHSLYLDVYEIKKLASMDTRKLNIFEVEEMFADAIKSAELTAPTMEECSEYHLKRLHACLLVPNEEAISIVKEIYNFTVEHDLFEEQMTWQEISDAIDDFHYGDNLNKYTHVKISEMIMKQARRIWHYKLGNIISNDLIGKKVTGIDSEVNFIIELDKGAIIIECPWRIRNTDEILVGETDIASNNRQWKTVKELLIGRSIQDIQLLENCPLLIIQMDSLFVDIFHASAFFDGWTLTDEEGFYLFSMHGGTIA